MDRVLQFPTIWIPRGFNREKRIHESRIGTPGSMTGGMQNLSGVNTGLYGSNSITDFLDTFIEASPPVSLTSHTPNTGTSWTFPAADGAAYSINPSGDSFIDTNGNSFNARFLQANPAPGAADYSLEVDAIYLTDPGANFDFGVRYAAGDYFFLRWALSAARVVPMQRISGTITEIGSTNYVVSTSTNALQTFKITVAGTSPNITLTVTVNGVAQTPLTGLTTLDAAGHAARHDGIAVTSTTGCHCRRFKVTRP